MGLLRERVAFFRNRQPIHFFSFDEHVALSFDITLETLQLARFRLWLN